MLVNDPGYASQDPDLFNGNAMTYYGRWDYKFNEAASRGAAGAIIVHDTLPAAYGWNTVENSWTGPQFDMVLADQGESLTAVEGWITERTRRNPSSPRPGSTWTRCTKKRSSRVSPLCR